MCQNQNDILTFFVFYSLITFPVKSEKRKEKTGRRRGEDGGCRFYLRCFSITHRMPLFRFYISQFQNRFRYIRSSGAEVRKFELLNKSVLRCFFTNLHIKHFILRKSPGKNNGFVQRWSKQNENVKEKEMINYFPFNSNNVFECSFATVAFQHSGPGILFEKETVTPTCRALFALHLRKNTNVNIITEM